MAFTQCPICTKRYPQPFIVQHAATCSVGPKSAISKRKRRNTLGKILRPRYRTKPSPCAPLSETAAPGFHVFPNVFTEEEGSFLQAIKETPPTWVDYRFRKVKHYGPAYNLQERRFLFGVGAPKEIPLPSYARDVIIPRLRTLSPVLREFNPNQMAVGMYPVPGESYIMPHNDCENGIIHTAVVGVCLAARCTMTFILRARNSGVGTDIKKDVVLPRGAVYAMSGDALRVWEHAIFPGKTEATRYSLTFRDVSPFKDEAHPISKRTKPSQQRQTTLSDML